MSTESTFEATPASQLENEILNPCIPKNEREHWAAREIERLREIVSRTAASAEQTAVPTGWKLVPVNPTPEMHVAADALVTAAGGYVSPDEAYDAMLAAAPRPPQQPSAAPESEQKPIGYLSPAMLANVRHAIDDLLYVSCTIAIHRSADLAGPNAVPIYPAMPKQEGGEEA
jgi:hypothetical protein